MSVSFSPVSGILRQEQFAQASAFGPVHVLRAGGPHLGMGPLTISTSRWSKAIHVQEKPNFGFGSLSFSGVSGAR